MNRYITLIFAFLFLTSCTSDWIESFDSKEKKPFGTEVLQNEMETLFPDEKHVIIKRNFIDDVIENNTVTPSGNYIAIDNHISYNQYTSNELLAFVGDGNIAFLASRNLDYHLSQALGLYITQNSYDTYYQNINTKDDDFTLHLTAKNWVKQSFPFKRYLIDSYIWDYNDQTTSVLGYYENEIGKQEVNFVRVAYGDGAFYIHTQPRVFTNFYMLNDSHHAEYISHCLSYLREDAIFWDNHDISNRTRSKPFEVQNHDPEPESLSELDYFLEHDSLRMALYTTLLGFGLFLLFKTKRNQRIIPIIPPLQNTSVAFTKTISNLYLNNKSNEDIAHKKLTYFYEKIRSELRINTQHVDDLFLKSLEQKTQLSRKEINDLFIIIRKTNDKIKGETLYDEDLITLDQALHTFYTKTKLL